MPSEAVPKVYPHGPIKVIVPFDAGGGSDTFTRLLQQAIERHDLLPQPLVVINVPGAGGSIGARRVKNASPNGYTLLQLHEAILTNKYGGNADYGPEAFEPIAGTGRMVHVVAVVDDSPYRTLNDLMRAATESPERIVFAVGIGAPSHFTAMLLERAAGDARFRFSQSGGGAKRFASLLGKHTGVTTFSIAEFAEFHASGLRALAVLSEQRHPSLPEVPTAREQGIDVVSTNMHYWWAPKGTPPDRIETLGRAIQAAMETEEMQMRLQELLTEPIVLRGGELTADLELRESQTASVIQRPQIDLPNFPALILIASLVMLGLVVVFSEPRGARSQNATSTLANLRVTLGTCGLVVAYVLVMQFQWLSFRMATCGFVALTGGLMVDQRGPKHLAGISLLALVLGFGLDALFRHVFVIDLPQ